MAPETEYTVVLDADPRRVWEVVSDITVPTNFSPELRRVRWLDGATGPALGARFEGHNHNDFLGWWRTESHVVAWKECRVFAWAVVDPERRFGGEPDPARPVATWRYDLVPEPGGARLRHHVRLGPARSGLSLATDAMPDKAEAIVRQRLADLRTAMTATLEGIARLVAERDAGPPAPFSPGN
ncbi:polyketide cyclase [Saccharomonospora piscinae]|uniref:Polyketide cyclase n=1 Tax=Saccharomonospora piscinae TaxID=687388 RepID=A0A1V9A6J6_SACPI|nr:SRPBCC family protein [Saccharomonospora piscinae]OQO92711.1 polyketide cyclase [Saccharomonospora piscinae]TLW91579.1 SRPBCC family protein [Saccharomonospora piscinae]